MNEAEQRLTQVRAYATQCIKEEADATLNLINQLDENFDKAVSLMYHCTWRFRCYDKGGHCISFVQLRPDR